ncbi:hypothetical protein DFJ67_5861 [Asanoa ferruginea]|uniref:Uncharacterized protein n=1 Tax=Asanoa ferruginea TaxID=53367 RepID=A0A3D9ZRQ3_9ACTN|nr:hypothetical protein [Asanoa ferruginea]REF99817.1 hypothetical protein DFJ67_5861 [Asanoa ferruginea]GIF51835.1 hypothetical protein Afe04nite_63740 [Asanoa ferruginea]
MSDELDNLIHGAFTEFDATERSSHLPTPGAGAVRHTVAFRRKARLTTFSVVGALLIAVPIAAYAANPRGNNSPPELAGSASPTAPAGPTATARPTPSHTPPTTVVPPADVRNTTLNLPAFPGLENQCSAKGKKKFVNGKATTQKAELTIGELRPVTADLDGVPGDELLTTISCQNDGSVHPTQLLALKVAPNGELTPMGYVVNSPDAANMTAEFSRAAITVKNGVVRLVVYGVYQSDGWMPCDRQVRGYGFHDGAFRQVDGPTRFRKPSKDFRKIDFRNTGFLMGVANSDGSGNLYCVTTVNGAGEADIYDADSTKDRTHYTITIGDVSFYEARDGLVTFAVLTLRSPSGKVSQTLQSFRQDGDYPLGQPILRSGTAGVSRIDKAEVHGDLVQVTVRTSSGQQVWSYRPNGVGSPWQRVTS